MALLVLSGISVLFSMRSHHWPPWNTVFLGTHLPDLGLLVTFWYSSVVATLTLLPAFDANQRARLTRHINAILLVTFAVYAYRDLWPLCLTSVTAVPEDLSRDSPALLWTKVALLALVSILIPIFTPREHASHSAESLGRTEGEATNVNQQSGASLFSLIFYTFLDSVVAEAQRVPYLPHESLPDLVHEDGAEKLKADAFPYLDPFFSPQKRDTASRIWKKREHLFFSLVRVFHIKLFVMALALAGSICAGFLSPLALNRILHTIENHDSDDRVHPFVWVACLFLGPTSVSLCEQWYYYTSNVTLARARAILTELVFEHSLRVRFKAETEEKGGNPESEGESQTNEKRLTGRINTLVTVDVDNIAMGNQFLSLFLQGPLELTLALVFLYLVLGWSSIVAFVSIVLLLPVPGYLANLMQRIQNEKMTKTDARVQAVTEAVGVLRMIKLFGWEKMIANELKEKREAELIWIWKSKVVALLNDLITHILPIVTMLATYASYTLLQNESLTASKLFSSMAVFTIIRNLLNRSGQVLDVCVRAKVSLDRMSAFLADTELLDAFEGSDEEALGSYGRPAVTAPEEMIGFNNAVFTWSNMGNSGEGTPSSRSFRLRAEHLAFKRGAFNLIVGPTGCGKTSILMALLGEMHFLPTGPDSWYNLPRSRGVAYAAQESWVQNATVRENILFGSPFNEERYERVIYQCALKRDLNLFDAGDLTEVGEKGLTLSGGQKARVTLARAIYSSAEIVLLDDVLAALDVHTSKWIVEECFTGDLVRGRTIVLVTHNIALTSPIADYIVTVGPDGIAHEVGTRLSDVLADSSLAREVEVEREDAKIEEVIDEVKKDGDKADGKLILAEEVAQGRVTWKALGLYIRGLGGHMPALFLTFFLGGLVLEQVCNMSSVWFLGQWGSQYEHHNPSEIPVFYYLAVYSAIQVVSNVIYVTANLTYIFGTRRASRSISSQLIDSVLVSTLRWLDETPASRIIARFTQDLDSVDIGVTETFSQVCDMVVLMFSKLAGPVIFTPIFLIPGLFIAGAGMFISNLYLRAQMSVKRHMSNARSPVLAHFGAAVVGIVSIRAYGAQDAVMTESMKRINHYTKIARSSNTLNRWISVRMDLLGAIFTSSLAAYLLHNRALSAANTGFSLAMAIEFTHDILWVVYCYNGFEINSNSLERIQAYLDIDHEPPAIQGGKPPAAWPTNGNLRVENLSARYSLAGPLVLRDINFEVKSGERVGIVGRTGSGKSTLTLALLRLVLTEGTVYLDDIPTEKINLEELRSKITIIPQVPELLTGTLRRNMDPFEQHSDAELNNALRSAGLFALHSDEDTPQWTLDSNIASGGSNLSVGQRQIIALARAIVRNSKLLILDEATSAIDHKTDSIIQTALRHELAADVSVITVAHRLQTIMDADRIVVLEHGRIVECDSPQILLDKPNGVFKALVDESGDRNALYAMVNTAGNPDHE
ncbi:hypothetical protein D9619_003959 [Psilocybe cf. subviscida]|uniref:P-loop containing nucleoside triphosphate hydrolase protein n=1 Tax=Psilocybe cf. subviscida TaxID=2480587 RepID=A0A8H5BS96_9AGAR|nr:hypothetical protein D9619_003959 [Psilocybe cf. subviscida]